MCESKKGNFQCLFYLVHGLPLDDCTFKRKYTLQNHISQWHLQEYGSEDPIPCPDLACVGIILNGNKHFKQHAKDEHNFVL
jgi:hypothetical protein